VEKIISVFISADMFMRYFVYILKFITRYKVHIYIYRAMYILAVAVSCTVCGNQEVVGSNPIAPLMGVVAQLAERLI